MTEHIDANAAGALALPEGHPEREAALAHARSCPSCQAALDEAAFLFAELGALEPLPPPSAAALSRTLEAVRAEMRREQRRALLPSQIAGTLAAFIVVVILSHHRATDLVSLGAALLGVLAAVTIGLVPFRGLSRVGMAAGASLTLAFLTGRAGGLALHTGAHCLVLELVAAALPLALTWFVSRRFASPSAESYAVIAALGALAGAAGLSLTCPAHTHFAHLFVFHVLGVVLAAGAGLLAGKKWLSPKPVGSG